MQDNLSGIYCIENLVNHKKYIGMSRDIKRRWIEHRTELNHNQHDKEYWKNYDWKKVIHEKLSKAHSRKNISKETLKKLSEATSGSNNPRSMKVYCPQLDETFDCMTYATEKYGINKGSISSCIKGKLKSAGKHPITGERLTWELIEK